MDTLDQILQNLWTSDYVQSNPNKAYKSQYNSEYGAISSYISGGSRPSTTNWSKMGRVLVGLEDQRRAATTPEPEPPGDVLPAPQNLAALHSAASAGAVIRLGAGNHGDHTLTLAKEVTFQLENGAVVGNVHFAPGCKKVTVKAATPLGAKIGHVRVGNGAGSPAEDIVVRDLDGFVFEINNSLRFRSYGCDWGAAVNIRPVIAMYSQSARPIDTLIKGGWIHGMMASPPDNPNFHADGILIYCGNGVVIDGVKFSERPDGTVDKNGGTGDLGIWYRTDPNFANVIVKNCSSKAPPWAANGDSSFNVQCDRQIYGLRFENNSFPKGIAYFGSGANPAVAPPPNWPPT